MTHLVENDPVRTLFGSEQLPASYDIVLRRILNDNWITLRLNDLMERHFAALAIAQAQEGEWYALKRRITLALTSNATAAEKPGELNIEAAQDRVRLHNSGDHSLCTPGTCYQKAVLSATPPREAEVPTPNQYREEPAPRPAPTRPHISWYIDPVGQRIVAEVPNDEVRWFTGAPENAAKFVFRGEACPAHIVAQYARLKA